MARFSIRAPSRPPGGTADMPAGSATADPDARPRRRSLLRRGLARLKPGSAHRRQRYLFVLLTGLALIWTPIIAYVVLTPKGYTAEMSLILPGSGALTSINVSEIGQATSSAPSAYGSPSLSPTVTYKNLITSGTVLTHAAEALGEAPQAIGKPVIKLVNETSLINFSMKGGSPEQALARIQAVFDAFQTELDRLRDDEIRRREHSTRSVIGDYEDGVRAIRTAIGELQTASGLNSIDQYNGMIATAEGLRTRLMEARAGWADATAAVDRLALALHTTPELAAKTIRLHADPEFNTLMESVGKAASEVAELSARFGPRHPMMAAARLRLAGATRQAMARATLLTGLPEATISREIDQAATGNRAELLSRLISAVSERDGKAAELDSLTRDSGQANARVTALVETAARLESLNRDYRIAEAVFASALARVDTVKADIFASYPMTQVAEPARLPERPSSPRTLLAVAAGLAASVFLGISLFLGSVRRTVIDRLVTHGRRLGMPPVPPLAGPDAPHA